MPLNKKGAKIKASMVKQYGAKKGKQVFYASEHSGKIKGVKKRGKSSQLGFAARTDSIWLRNSPRRTQRATKSTASTEGRTNPGSSHFKVNSPTSHGFAAT